MLKVKPSIEELKDIFLHFPLLHTREFCLLHIKVLVAAGLALLSLLCASKMPSHQTVHLLFSALAICTMVSGVFNSIILIKKIVVPCSCGHFKSDVNLVTPILLYSGIGFEIILCSWICHIGIMQQFGGAFASSVIIGAISFLVPAVIFSLLISSGRVDIFQRKMRS